MSDYELQEDDLETYLEDDDSDLDDELLELVELDAEARKRRRRPVKTGQGAGYFRPRPATAGGVTQVQLQAALAKVSKDVKANAAGIKSVGARVDAAAAAQRRQAALAKREAARRKTEMTKIKSSLQMAAILPLITAKSITTTQEAGGIPVGSKLQVAPDAMTAMLPMMLGDGFGGGSGGDSTNMMFMALAMSGGLR